MDEVKVSVCMVTYNHERYIAQAVESALAQRTNFPIEIVIGEDCSTDNTRVIVSDIARRHPAKIHLRLADRNLGAKTNFNQTLASCRGQYVALLEGDDYWSCPDKLQRQADALDARPDWAMCFHPTQCIYEDGMQGQASYPLDWQKPEATLEDLLEANFIPTNSALFRNRLPAELPPCFDDLKQLGDWPRNILHAVHGNIGFLPDIMSAYRIHRRGLWSGEAAEVRLIAIVQMFNALDHHFAGQYAAAIERNRKRAIDDLAREIESMRSVLNSHQEMRANYNQLADERTALIAAVDELTSAHERLTESHRVLQEFYDAWNRSIPGRVVRETRRLYRQVENLVRRRDAQSCESTQRHVNAHG